MNPKLHPILTELRKAFQHLYRDRLIHMILFGSQARGDSMNESDIDILIVIKGQVNPGDEIRRTGEISSELSLKNDVVISCTFISSERYETEKSPLLLNVRKEGLII
jgi:predicted nucleotidyltransferase